MITATLTRPTTIAPTMCCEHKIYLVEQVDVGSVTPPRPRTIYLEPISKRSKRRKPHQKEKAGSGATDTLEQASDGDPTRAHETSTESSASEHREDNGHDVFHFVQNSPVHSDFRSISGDSALSGSTGWGKTRDESHGGQPSGSQASRHAPTVGSGSRTITAIIELVKGGCIPGDTLPVKISVQHIKSIKSMHGVIVTLCRQGRIDTAPPISSFKGLSADEIERLEKEELYPRSRTGLGGLSLTSTGSCSVYRKDLSQAFSPLIIDPGSLTANVTASVRVPENAFPTIKEVPGNMITFKYYLEVIVDLGGKLARQLQGGSSSSVATSGLTASPGFGVAHGGDARSSMAPFFGNGMLNTDPLRRERGVVCVVFELVVGTTDTQRERGRVASQAASVRTKQFSEGEHQHMSGEDEDQDNGGFLPENHDALHPPYEPGPPTQHQQWKYASPGPPSAAPEYIPLPSLPDERELPEKERIQRAEQRLLPSRPLVAPADAAGLAYTRSSDQENIYDAEDDRPSVPPSSAAGPAAAGHAAPSAPTLEELGASTGAGPAEDKQELERRRLLEEASAPPEVPDDYDGGAVAGSSDAADAAGPSAPVLTEEDEYGSSFARATASGPLSVFPAPSGAAEEPLPRYER